MVDDADTLWPPQLFGAITFESESHGKFEWRGLVCQYFGSHPAPGRPLGHVNAWTDRAPFFCKCYFAAVVTLYLAIGDVLEDIGGYNLWCCVFRPRSRLHL